MDPSIKTKNNTKKVILLSFPPKICDLSFPKTRSLPKISSVGPLVFSGNWTKYCIMLCFKNLKSSIETTNLKACKLCREYKNGFVISFLTPTFGIAVLLYPSLYREEKNLSSFLNMQNFSPHSVLRPGVQQLYLLLCEEHIFLF